MQQIELQILEKLKRGKPETEAYKGKNVFSVRKTEAHFSKRISETLKIKLNDEAIMSTDGKNWYLAILPFDSKLNGYKVRKAKKEYERLKFSSVSYVDKGLPIGIYEIKEPLHYKDIDWYLCEKIED